MYAGLIAHTGDGEDPQKFIQFKTQRTVQFNPLCDACWSMRYDGISMMLLFLYQPPPHRGALKRSAACAIGDLTLLRAV